MNAPVDFYAPGRARHARPVTLACARDGPVSWRAHDDPFQCCAVVVTPPDARPAV